MVIFCQKLPYVRGSQSMLLASNVTQVAVSSKWNGSYGSMRPYRHVRHLAAVIGGMADAQWVQNSRAGGGHFWPEIPMSEVWGGFSGKFLASNVTQKTVISGWNGLDGSMGPGGHIKCLDLVMGPLPGAQCVRSDRLRGSFLA